MSLFLPYYRVSTEKQGQSGLGLEEQKRSVKLITDKGEVVGSFTEIESGGKNNRIELKKAIALCKAKNATLVVARLDRLSRKLAFIVYLRSSGIKFICADEPEMNNLTTNIKASFAEEERENISKNTKRGLSTIKHIIKEQGFYISKKGNKITSLGRQIKFEGTENEQKQQRKEYFTLMANQRVYSVKSETAVLLCQSLYKNGLNAIQIKNKLEELPENYARISLRTIYNYIKN